MDKTIKTDDSGYKQNNRKQVNIHIREAGFVLERDGNVNGWCSNYTFCCLDGIQTIPSAVWMVFKLHLLTFGCC
jgi:hypothetical protein